MRHSRPEASAKARKLLFLLGGSSEIFDAVAEHFVPAAGGADATIALLLRAGPGWQEYVSQYAQPWTRLGVTRHHVIVPADDDALDQEEACTKLRDATGVFIGGGDTAVYHSLYATEPIRSIVRESYQRGVPIAGLSAGAMLLPEICAIPPRDSGDSPARILPGLGLLSGLIIGVHFTERHALPHVLETMASTRTSRALGLDEKSCALLVDGTLERVLCGSVYQIAMTDFGSKAHTLERIAGSREPVDSA